MVRLSGGGLLDLKSSNEVEGTYQELAEAAYIFGEKGINESIIMPFNSNDKYFY